MTLGQPTRRGLIAGLAGLSAGAARAAIPRGDLGRYVFVPGQRTSVITVFDTDSNPIAGRFDIGIVPKQIEISREVARLVATDGQSSRIVVFNVPTEEATTLDLPLRAERISLGGSGWLLAVMDRGSGRVAVVDLLKHRVVMVIDGLIGLRDAMFGGQDGLLYLATEGSPDIAVIDSATGARKTDIRTGLGAVQGIRSLARLPDGRRILTLPIGGGAVKIVDPESGASIGSIEAGFAPAGVIPSGTGRFLLIPDGAHGTVGVSAGDGYRSTAVLPSVPGVFGLYPAWLDSILFAAGTGSRVAVYDLDVMRQIAQIALPGIPTAGAVTLDSMTVYLPVVEPAKLVVLDGRTRTITAMLDLPASPLAAIIPGGFGVCH